MSSTARDDPAIAVRQVPALLYPTLLIAGIAVIVASLLGIAVMTGLLPSVAGRTATVTGNDSRPAAAAPCAACGVVETVRELGPAGVAGGILGSTAAGGSGHETGDNMKNGKGVTYEVRVRMDDRSYRMFRAAQPGFGTGQRVKVREGRLVRAD
jgi:hypothetical protein